MKYVEKAMEISLLGCVFFSTFELAASFSFYLLELSAVVLALSIIVLLVNHFGFHPFKWMQEVLNRLSLQKGVWIFLLSYLVWDVVTLSYSPVFATAITKYKVIVLMALIVVGMVLYCTTIAKLKKVLAACSAAGVFTATFAVLNIFLKIYPIYYIKRLSLRVDYNMFAVTIFTGFITAFLLLLDSEFSRTKQSIYTVVISSICIPAIVLSGSRRTFLLLAPTILLFFIIWHLTQKYSGLATRFGSSVAMVGAILVLSFGLIMGIRIGLSNVAKEDVVGIGGGGSSTETSALERYESMGSGSLFEKRSAIWLTAIDEIKTYDYNEFLFGKGNGYDIYFYDIVDDARLNNVYNMETVKGAMSAHNFLIADMMNGGIIKLSQAIIIWILILKLMLSLLVDKEEKCSLYLFKMKNKCITSHGIIYSLIIGNTLISSLISNRFGFIYERFFYIFLFLALIEANIKGIGGIHWKK